MEFAHTWGYAKVQHVVEQCQKMRRCTDLTASEKTFLAALEASIA